MYALIHCLYQQHCKRHRMNSTASAVSPLRAQRQAHSLAWQELSLTLGLLHFHFIPYSLGVEPVVTHQTSWLDSTCGRLILKLSAGESTREAHLNAFRLEICNDLSSAKDSTGSAHVKLHELYHAAHLQVVPSTVKGQPFAYQSNLLLHRACTGSSTSGGCTDSCVILYISITLTMSAICFVSKYQVGNNFKAPPKKKKKKVWEQ